MYRYYMRPYWLICRFGVEPGSVFYFLADPKSAFLLGQGTPGLQMKYDFTGDPESANEGACVTPVLDMCTGRPLICISGIGSDPESVVPPKK